MKENLSEWNIVLAGKWNPYIFSPNWLCNVLLNIKEIQSEFAVGPELGHIRHVTENLILIPRRDRLILGLRNTKQSTLTEAEAVAIKTLTLLAHTPINAVGVNFSFTEEFPSPDILQIFNLADNEKLADAQYEPMATEITRDIKLDGGTILKLKLAVSEVSQLKMHLNYHHPIVGDPNESAAQAASLLNGKTLHYRDKSLSLLKQVYHLIMEELDDSQNGN